jgi:YD repeat-containing protein
VLTRVDPANHQTSYTYYSDNAFTGVDPLAIGHTIGDLQTITNPAGQVTTYNSYDRAGRVRSLTDAKGVVTDTTYTPRGWISSLTVTPPGLSARTINYSYDAVGQLTGVANPDGTSQSYSYDPAHRLTGVTDNRGNSVTYTLDNVGNRTAEQIKDPGGVLQRAISRSFDALNRVQQVSGAAQ